MASSAEKVAIQIDQVSKQFISPGKIHLPTPKKFKFRFEPIQKKLVLNKVSLDISKGGIFGFLGPNGAGKTTLIKAMTGLLRPDSGSISIFDSQGVAHNSFSKEAKKHFGYLPERPYYHEFLTAEEFLQYHGALHGLEIKEIGAKIPQLLSKVGLKDVRDQKLGTFSKGMLQRIGIAQALLRDPEILIFDEPMSGLDPLGRREVRDLIIEIASAGKTVFFSTHIIHDIEVICTSVAFIKNGKIKGSGSIESLLGKTVRSMEIRYSGSFDPAKIEVLKNSKKTMDGWVIEIESEANRLEYDVQEVLHRILGSKGFVQSVTPRKSTLEDLFLQKPEIDGEA